MRHEAGLDKLAESIPMAWTLTENVKVNKIGALVERTPKCTKAYSERTYHGFTRDWITNEIFRRVEPQGRTMGEYFEQEIAP